MLDKGFYKSVHLQALISGKHIELTMWFPMVSNQIYTQNYVQHEQEIRFAQFENLSKLVEKNSMEWFVLRIIVKINSLGF